MKIGKKLIIAFLIVTILSSFSGILSTVLMSNSDKNYSDALINYGFSQGDIGLLLAAINDNCTNMMMMMATSDEAEINKASQTIDKNVTNINQYMTNIEPTLVGSAEQAYYDTISKNLPLFSEHAQEVIALARENKNIQALKVYNEETLEHINAIKEGAQGLMDSNVTNGKILSDNLSRSSVNTIITVIIIIAVSIGLSVFLSVYMARSISLPMAACTERISALSQGDLKSPVPEVKTKDETGILAAATAELVTSLSGVVLGVSEKLGHMAAGEFNIDAGTAYRGDFLPIHTAMATIINSLNSTLTQINHASDQVASGADQVSDGAQALSQGATEQASSVEELAATITEISEQIRNNADNAALADKATDQTAAEVTNGNEQMQEMIAAIHNISDSSTEISKIIKTIEDIAFQTNILALNAAVEAARAGAAGKGFAVVADEVRSLATKSQEAAKNTTALIQNSIDAVNNGTKIASKTAESLTSIMNSTLESTELVRKIAEASEQQAMSIGQITQGIDQISAVVQTNSATAEESAAASEELSGQAQLLKELISKFSLKDSESYA